MIFRFGQEKLNVPSSENEAGNRLPENVVRIKPGNARLDGNLFDDGRIVVEIAVSSHIPETRVHFRTGEVIGFEASDNAKNSLTRGDYIGTMPGVVRPAAKWETNVIKTLKD